MIPSSDEEYYYKLDNMMLSSCQYLRQVFGARWKLETGEDWVDDRDHLERFVEGVGQTAFKLAPRFQKDIMRTQCVEEWDTSMLTFVIQHVGLEKKYRSENMALRNLKNIRNDLAHNANKKVSKQNFHHNMDIFFGCLQTLGVDAEEIKKLVEKTGVTSSVKALKHMKTLHKKAVLRFKEGKVDKAADCYSEAIVVPSLLPVNIGTAYEKRAEFFLSLVKNPLTDQDQIKQILLDAIKALDFNDSSWRAHYLAAQGHQLNNNLNQALKHYEHALAISPVQKQVKDDYDGCKVLAGMYKRQDHLHPHGMHKNVTELVTQLGNETGIKMSEKNFIRLQDNFAKHVKGQNQVYRGKDYFNGWDVPQNYTEAAKHFAQAAEQKNAEGMYMLGTCYYSGKGVKQDFKEALRLYRETAEMDPKTPGVPTLLGFNSSVACAQHCLGLMYNEGIGVEQDFVEAAAWYKKAMENGAGNAANNLGNMYATGRGMPVDDKMAESCWKQAINFGSPIAPIMLMSYYLNQLEPDKALNMARIGREMGNGRLLNFSDAELNASVEAVRSERKDIEPEIIKFEKINSLDVKGLTFMERALRRDRLLDHELGKLSTLEDEPPEPASKLGKLTPTTLSIINTKAEEGSVTALRIMETHKIIVKLEQLLTSYTEKDEDQNWEILDLLYKCKQLEFHLLRLSQPLHQKLKSVVAKLFEKKCNAKGKADEKIRLCFVAINLQGSCRSDNMYAVELLKTGVKRYPNNLHYYADLADLLGLKKKFKEGRSYAEEGLKRFPDSVDLLYSRAVCIHRESPSVTSTIERAKAYKKFLSVAPIDHWKVPEACYQISSFFSIEYQEQDPANFDQDLNYENIEKIIRGYFCRGQESEKCQMPCYVSHSKSQQKCQVENFVRLLDAGGEIILDNTTLENLEAEQKRKVSQRKGYLMSQVRKTVILWHRKQLKHFESEAIRLNKLGHPFSFSYSSPNLKQTVAKRMSNVEPITLQEMNPRQDKIYENKSLDLTIVDDLMSVAHCISLVAEDSNGDVTKLFIYNVAKDKETLEKLQPGCRIAIVNPYMRIAARDFSNGIRNDEPKCLVFLKKLENMCRFCGEGNAMQKCSTCKRPYCSRECQKLDWKELDHKLICSLQLNLVQPHSPV